MFPRRVFLIGLLLALAACGGKKSAPTQPVSPAPSQVWQDLGLTASDGAAFALTVYGNHLIAGGLFTSPGGNSSLVQWDGSRWTPFAKSPVGVVEALALHQGELIAGVAAPVDTLSTLEAWNGTSWRSLGTFSHTVLAMTPYKTGLAVGGHFVSIDRVRRSFVAWWDGAQWHDLGTGVVNPVHALTVFRGDLIAAGRFWEAGGTPAAHIARWDGQAWHPLGAGLDGTAMSLAVHEDRLIVGGEFNFAGSERVNGVASWDGATWSPVGQGLKRTTTDVVFSLILYNGELIATGRFPDVAARWRGGGWKKLPGLEPTAFSSIVYKGRLIAGGTFRPSTAGTPNLVGRWVE